MGRRSRPPRRCGSPRSAARPSALGSLPSASKTPRIAGITAMTIWPSSVFLPSFTRDDNEKLGYRITSDDPSEEVMSEPSDDLITLVGVSPRMDSCAALALAITPSRRNLRQCATRASVDESETMSAGLGGSLSFFGISSNPVCHGFQGHGGQEVGRSSAESGRKRKGGVGFVWSPAPPTVCEWLAPGEHVG